MRLMCNGMVWACILSLAGACGAPSQESSSLSDSVRKSENDRIGEKADNIIGEWTGSVFLSFQSCKVRVSKKDFSGVGYYQLSFSMQAKEPNWLVTHISGYDFASQYNEEGATYKSTYETNDASGMVNIKEVEFKTSAQGLISVRGKEGATVLGFFLGNEFKCINLKKVN